MLDLRRMGSVRPPSGGQPFYRPFAFYWGRANLRLRSLLRVVVESRRVEPNGIGFRARGKRANGDRNASIILRFIPAR